MAFVFVGCDKETDSIDIDVDASMIELEVKIRKIDYSPYYNVSTYACEGSIGGYLGVIHVLVDGYRGRKVNVNGAKTPFAFTFTKNEYGSSGQPELFYVRLLSPNNETLMGTTVIPE
jgi:hypothetical protein